MAVNLRDAKISVKLDLKGAKADVESLEKRTVRQRKEAKKEKRKAVKTDRGIVKARRAGGAVRRAVTSAGLMSLIRGGLQAVSSIPIVELGAAVGLGALVLSEANQRFGPAAEAFINRFLASKGIPAGELKLATAAAKEMAELKATVNSLGAGFAQATKAASADILTGGTVSADEFAQIFTIERRFAEFSTNLRNAEQRMRLQLLGGGVAESFVNELEKAVSGSLNK